MEEGRRRSYNTREKRGRREKGCSSAWRRSDPIYPSGLLNVQQLFSKLSLLEMRRPRRSFPHYLAIGERLTQLLLLLIHRASMDGCRCSLASLHFETVSREFLRCFVLFRCFTPTTVVVLRSSRAEEKELQKQYCAKKKERKREG